MIGAGSDRAFTYKFRVLGHHVARLQGNEPHITVTFLAGQNNNLTYCGTFTMAESEWGRFSAALQHALGSALVIEDERARRG